MTDFDDDDFAGLALLNRDELDDLCKSNDINMRTRGPGATNKSKREALRAKGKANCIPLVEWQFPISGKLRRYLSSLFPVFESFGIDKKSDIQDDFQEYLFPILNLVSTDTNIEEKHIAYIGALRQSFNEEIGKVIGILQRYTDSFSRLSIVPELNLQEAIRFNIYRIDGNGLETSIDNIGSGSRRLLMLAIFQYLAEKDSDDNKNIIYAIEEPENCLHPGLQRKLAQAFSQLADKGYQIIITSHSPVFVGQSPIEALTLVTKNEEGTKIIQYPSIKLEDIANQLGIEPSDQITEHYTACVGSVPRFL